MLGIRTSRILVVSGGGSAASRLGCRPSSPAVPARVNRPRNARRVQPSACGALIGDLLSLTVTVRTGTSAQV
jgi:hypothetical protein